MDELKKLRAGFEGVRNDVLDAVVKNQDEDALGARR